MGWVEFRVRVRRQCLGPDQSVDALFDFAERCRASLGYRAVASAALPACLGAWPACALFYLLAWFELVAPGRDVPRNIAVAIAIYSALTLAGFVVFRPRAWCSNVEVFSVLFGLFGRFAPLHFDSNGRWRWSLRPFAVGLLVRTPLDAFHDRFHAAAARER